MFYECLITESHLDYKYKLGCGWFVSENYRNFKGDTDCTMAAKWLIEKVSYEGEYSYLL
jgi:hypothetical protein